MGGGQKQGFTLVFFMDGAQVARQMRWGDFEAFLDGYVGLSDLADQDVRAVYLHLSPQLTIQSLVFFRIYFNDEGNADSSWNLPLERLAERGANGPDLGSGPVRLVCKSQNPEPAFSDGLWDPDLSPSSNTLQSIRRAVEANSLRLPRSEPEPAEEDVPVLTEAARPEPQPSAEEEHRRKLAGLIKQQRLRIKTLQSAHRDQIRELTREHRLEIQALNQQMQDQKRQLERYRVQNDQLKERLASRNEQYLELQQRLEAAAESGTSEHEQVLLREQLERKERELAMSREEVRSLREDLRDLQMAQPEEDSILERLQDQSLFLVAYHPGLGHLTLPYDDIGRYFENPQAYVASQCGLSENAYREWLAHYEEPVCQAKVEGERCGEPLVRVSDPAEYREGIDNRCERHL